MGRLLRAAAMVVMACAMLAPGSARAEVEERGRYDPAFGAPGVIGSSSESGFGGYYFSATGLTALRATLTDENTPLIPVWQACQSTDGDLFACERGEPNLVFECTNTGSLIAPVGQPQFRSNLPISIFVYNTGAIACPAAVATSGWITITYEDPEEL